MEKEYLGLGVVFNSLDKGFKKSIEGIKAALVGANDAMVKTSKTAASGIFNNIGEGLKALSLARIGSTLNEIKDGIDGTGHGVNDLAKSLDMTRAKMTAALDPKQAAKFQGQMMGLVSSMGLTGDQAETISHNLLNSGASIDKMGGSLPMIGTLVGKLGMDAGQVSTMFGQMQGYLKMSSKQATGLTKTIFKLQKDYGLTNLMEPLPEIVDNVYANMIKLGKTSPMMAMRMVADVTKMTAAFQKLGMSQQKAATTAMTFNDKVNEVRNAFRDLQAGLDPESNIIQDIYDAFGAGGLNATGLITSIKSGKKTNEEIMKEMQDMVAKLPEQQRLNVMQRLRRTLGDDISNIIGPLAGQMKQVNAEAAKQSTKVGTADDAFASFNKSLDGTLEVQEKLMKGAKSFQEAITTLMIKGDLTTAMAANTKATNEFTKEILNADSAASMLARNLEGYKTMGLAYFFPDIAKAKPWLELFADLILPLTALWGILKIVAAPLKWLGVFLSKVFPVALEAAGEGVAFLTSPIGLVIGAITALIYFWDDLVDAVSWFDKDAGNSMREFGNTVGEVWGSIKKWVGVAWDFTIDFFKTLGHYAVPIIKMVGKTFINIVSIMIEGVKFFGAVWGLVIYGMWSLVKPIFTNIIALVKTLWPVAVTVFKAVADFFIARFNAVYNFFASFVTAVKHDLGVIYNYFVEKWTQIGDFLAEFGRKAANFLAPILDPIMTLFSKIKTAAAEFLEPIWNDYFLKPFMAVKGAIVDAFHSILDAMPDFMKHDLGAIANAIAHPASALKHLVGMDDDAATTMNGVGAAAPVAIAEAPGVVGTSAQAMAVKGQEGAPSGMNLSGIDLAPTAVPKVDDKNTQALLQMLAETKDAIVKAVAKGSTVNVTLAADARKFMTVLKQEQKNQAGTAGMNSALGG